MGCLSGCLVSSTSIQKLFCGRCSALKWSFDEFVGEKVVSLSYSSAILGPPLFTSSNCHSHPYSLAYSPFPYFQSQQCCMSVRLSSGVRFNSKYLLFTFLTLLRIFGIVPSWAIPGGSDGKESTCSVGDLGSIPGSGISPGEGNGDPLQYSWLGNSMDGGGWQATAYGIAKCWVQPSDFHIISLF